MAGCYLECQQKILLSTDRTFCCTHSDKIFLKCAIAIIKVTEEKLLLFLFYINNQLGNGMGKIKSIHNNDINYNTNYIILINLRRNVEGTQKI